MEVIINNHIKLELIESKHAQELYELALANRLYLREWINWLDQMHSVEFIEQFIHGSSQRNKAGIEFAFVIIADEVIIGRIGVYKINNQTNIGEIGYWIAEDQLGKGIVLSCCKGLIHFCFTTLQLNRIEIKCGTNNVKSRSVPEKLNFTKEGVMREAELILGKYLDLELYSLVRSDLNQQS